MNPPNDQPCGRRQPPAEGGSRTIRWLCGAPPATRDAYLNALIPAALLRHYRLPPPDEWHADDSGVYRAFPLTGQRAMRIEVWPDPDGEDPALSLELGDTRRGQLEAGWIVLNEINGPRFHVDRDAAGAPLAVGGPRRNQVEELRALTAGLAPNQVRPGMNLFRTLIEHIGELVLALGMELLYVVPLAYHNAIKYEHYGFEYVAGEGELHWIHDHFQPGGFLRRRLDGSRPFRQPWMAETIRGRSWAIRDGILGRHWAAPLMLKEVRRPAAVDTFPGGRW